MSTPIASVIIPAYNAEQTIAETVNSVLAQTFTDFELIIINDGSTDNTLRIIGSFIDHRIQTFTFENSGPQKSRNRGIEKAKGTFISFIDSDDLWTTEKLQSQIETLQKNPDASVVYSWCNIIDENGNFLRRGGYSKRNGDVFVDLLLVNFGESGSNFLAYLDAVKSVGGFDETIVAGQDRDILLSLANQYDFQVCPEVEVLYRKSKAVKSWSSSIKRAKQGIEQVINKHSQNKPELSIYRQQGLNNAYKYMVFECLTNNPDRGKGFYAIKLLWIILMNDRSFIRTKVVLKLVARILTVIILPQQVREKVFKVFPRFLDVTSIFSYLKVEKSLILKSSL